MIINKIKMAVLCLGMVIVFTSCNNEEPEPQTVWYKNMEQLWSEYYLGVEDAKVADASEIRDNLPVIARSNPQLSWIEEGEGMVLVGSLMSEWHASSWYVDSLYPLGNFEVWVTIPYDFEARLRSAELCTDSLECAMRVFQMLGLPPDSDNNTLVFFYADPNGMVRPSPDPEIDDSSASLEFSPGASEEYIAWFEANSESSYNGTPPYPWTRLGYTYDWHNGGENEQGFGEFIVQPNTTIKVYEKSSLWSWYQQLDR